MSASSKHKLIVIGRFGKTHGLKGWLRVNSETKTKIDILSYQPWLLENQGKLQTLNITGSMFHSETLLVHIEGYNTPEEAKALTGLSIKIERELLPKLSENEFYWIDLEGLEVVNTKKLSLGQVSHFIEAGACDVMVIKNVLEGKKEELLIPFDQKNVIKKVNFETGIIEVDWDSDF